MLKFKELVYSGCRGSKEIAVTRELNGFLLWVGEKSLNSERRYDGALIFHEQPSVRWFPSGDEALEWAIALCFGMDGPPPRD